MSEDEEKYSPYCENCTSCGETGCCPSISCARAILLEGKDISKCSYKNSNFLDIQFRYIMFEEMYELILKLGSEELREKIDEKYDLIYDEVYGE